MNGTINVSRLRPLVAVIIIVIVALMVMILEVEVNVNVDYYYVKKCKRFLNKQRNEGAFGTKDYYPGSCQVLTA